MYGLEAISDAGGWQMAALGVSIVFLSLIFLAIIISQLHNVQDFWAARKPLPRNTPEPKTSIIAQQAATLHHPSICPEDIDTVADLWAPLVRQLNDPFRLQDLYEKAANNNFPHPHLTINRLRQAGILVPVDDCLFSWNTNVKDADEKWIS
jgi:Na+-transporting methylmalonyl-CoA/oxaloacetate decarboxylase gamma subunit